LANFKPNQRISDVLALLDKGEFRIPNIQRGYEWDEDRVLKLLDSIMNGYPIGAIMLWAPGENVAKQIRSRPFVKDFDSTVDYLTAQPVPGKADGGYFVLDGQQRLQSLYLGIWGSRDGEHIFLQADHRPNPPEEDYRFKFLEPQEAQTTPWMVSLAEMIDLNFKTKGPFVDRLLNQVPGPDAPADSSERREVIQETVERFAHYFKDGETLLFQVVPDGVDYPLVLDIFERVNSGGMVLTKSDLLLCTLKLHWPEAGGRIHGTRERS